MDYFNSLTPKELAKFEKFVRSPYFNSYQTIISLFDFLKSNYPDVRSLKVMRKELTEYVYGKNGAGDVVVRKLISDFRKVFDNFLIQLETEKNELSNQVKLIESLAERNLHKHYSKIEKNLNTKFYRYSPKDDNYYLQKYNSLARSSAFNINHLHKPGNIEYQKSVDNLDNFYIFVKLETFINFINVEYFDKKYTFRRNLLTEINSHIESNRDYFYKNHRYIYARYLIYKLLSTKDDRYIQELKDYYKINKKHFKGKSLTMYFVFLVFYIRNKFDSLKWDDASKLLHEYFDLAVYLFSKDNIKLFSLDGQLEWNIYGEIVGLGILHKEFEWTKNFIHKFKKYIVDDFSNDAYYIAQAHYFFSLQNYKTSLTYLNKLSYKHYHNHYFSKFILLQIYYETHNHDILKTELNNFLLFSKRNTQMTKKRREFIAIFVTYFKKLMRLTKMQNYMLKKEAAKLQKELYEFPYFNYYILWFDEKIKELLGAADKKNVVTKKAASNL